MKPASGTIQVQLANSYQYVHTRAAQSSGPGPFADVDPVLEVGSRRSGWVGGRTGLPGTGWSDAGLVGCVGGQTDGRHSTIYMSDLRAARVFVKNFAALRAAGLPRARRGWARPGQGGWSDARAARVFVKNFAALRAAGTTWSGASWPGWVGGRTRGRPAGVGGWSDGTGTSSTGSTSANGPGPAASTTDRPARRRVLLSVRVSWWVPGGGAEP